MFAQEQANSKTQQRLRADWHGVGWPNLALAEGYRYLRSGSSVP